MTSVAHALARESTTLALRVVDAMYADPFWNSRFGARGRARSEEDVRYHVAYVVQALAQRDLEVFATYARWLRSILVSRRMCSRHLAESFTLLEAEIARSFDGTDDAIAVLRHGTSALAYDHGPPRELVALVPTLVREHASERPAARVDTGSLVHYLADALAAGRPELFETHVAWATGQAEGHEVRRFLPWLSTRLATATFAGARDAIASALRAPALPLPVAPSHRWGEDHR